MDEGVAQRRVVMQQRAAQQPVHEFVAVRGPQHRHQRRIGPGGARHTARVQRQQMQIVVAQHRHRRAAQRAHEAQTFQALRTAIDQIAGQPQGIGARIETQTIEQPPQRIEAALQITDGVAGHGSR